MKTIINKLRASGEIGNFVVANEKLLADFAELNSIDKVFIRTQLLLHLPYYDKEKISNNSSSIINDIKGKIINLWLIYKNSYDKLYDRTNLKKLNLTRFLRAKSQ